MTTDSDHQNALIGALLLPEAYPHAPKHVRHLQTHISHVFLTGDYAYKVKKPLNLGFLDFSTLEKRRQACEEELRINRRLAPDLYLGVVPVSGSLEYPKVEASGPPIEYAVKMREFDQDGLLDRVLERGELTASMIDALAHQVAEFHLGLSGAHPPDHCGHSAEIVSAALENFRQLRPLLHERNDVELADELQSWTRQQGDALAEAFALRRTQAFVRECHGDLHLGNLALIDGKVRIFDGIDFSEALRWTDVMNEVAFLMMDLAVRGRSDLAYRFLNQYLEITGDYEGVPLLRFYLVYRAIVRAKVEVIRASQTDLTDLQREPLMAQCRAQLMWAKTTTEDYRSLWIALHGFSGSGKTTHSMAMLESLRAIRMRSDIERKRLHRIDTGAHNRAAASADLYSSDATDRTYAYLEKLAQRIALAGYAVIIDATFLDRARRDHFRALANRLEIPFVIVDFFAQPDVLRGRVKQRRAHGNDASDADLRVLEYQLAHFDPLHSEELAHVVRINTETVSNDDIAHAISELAQRVRKRRH